MTPAQPTPDDFRWQAFFQDSREPLFVLNRQRRILFVNRAWEELTGLTATEARVLVCTRRAPASPGPGDDVARALSPPAHVRQGKPGRVRRLVPGPTGGTRTWDVDFFPLRDDKGVRGILGKVTAAADAGGSSAPLPERLVALREAVAQRYSLDALASTLPAVRRAAEQVRLAAVTRAPVLIVGEPGSGRQWLARTIHFQGPARELPFAALDCRRLPPEVLEATLFGEAGLVTRGRVGTLYLQEPAALPRDLQARLLEVLEDPGPAAPRFLAGSVTDLAPEAATGRFLEGLRCALAPLVVALPPLRQRHADLATLAERLLERVHAADGRPPAQLTPEAWELVRGYSWPGNLQELYTVLTAARARASAEGIEAAHLPAYLRLAVQMGQPTAAPAERPLPLVPLLEQVERRLIRVALGMARGNKTRAAELLAVWRPRLLRRMEALGIDEDDKGD